MIKFYSKSILIYGIIYGLSLLLTACAADLEDPILDDDPTEEIPFDERFGPDFPDTENSGENPEEEVGQLERSHILAKYHYLDPNRIIPRRALENTILYFDRNKFKIQNQNYLAVVNFAQSSKEKRFYIIDINTGSVQSIHVAHGKGSDINYDGYAERFSNKSGTNASSLGFYTTAETYYGSHGLSLRLDGRSSTNSNARRRAIVLHGSDYVREASLIQGRSWGCLAVSYELRDKVIGILKGGALINVVK